MPPFNLIFQCVQQSLKCSSISGNNFNSRCDRNEKNKTLGIADFNEDTIDEISEDDDYDDTAIQFMMSDNFSK